MKCFYSAVMGVIFAGALVAGVLFISVASLQVSVITSLQARSDALNVKSVHTSRDKSITLLGDDKARFPTTCRFEVQEFLHPEHQMWRNQEVPQLTSVINNINEGHQSAIFVTAGLQNLEYYTFSFARWECNENVVASITAQDYYQRHILVVHCPTQEVLKKLTVDVGDGHVISYNTTLLSQCDEAVHENEKPAQRSDIASCTMVKGKESRHLILQWVEYHRLIGVDHFWIFLHESLTLAQWNELPKRPYIVYVPFDFALLGNADYGFAGGAQQATFNECLYRSKAFNLTWLGIHDVDEYFHVTLPGGSNNLKTLAGSIPNASTYGGLSFRNSFFGRAPFQESATHELLLDYVGRGSTWEYQHGSSREKTLDRVDNVYYHFIHEIGSGGPTYVLDPETQGYHQHYKLATQGVFSRRDYEGGGLFKDIFEEAVEIKIDSRLRDKFSAKVQQAMLVGEKKWNSNLSIPQQTRFEQFLDD